MSYACDMSRSRVSTTQAIVLRRIDQGEADRLITVMTPERGKIRVVAKGARKITSRKAGHIELFACTQLLLAKGRTFDIVTQADLIDPHPVLRDDMQRGAMAHYVCDVIERFAQEEHEDQALYALLADALQWLSSARDAALIVRFVEMRLLLHTGYKPQLFRCVLSGAALEIDVQEGERSTPFSPADGGAVALAQVRQAHGPLMLSRGALLMLRALQTQSFEVVQTLELTAGYHSELERALQAFISYVLDGRTRTLMLAKQMQE
jgi:DNA repair protein RecO (recombination protein O)